MEKFMISIIVAVLTFLVLAIGYEFAIYLWAISQQGGGAVIRLDIILVYPLIIGMSVLAFYIHKYIQKKKKQK